MEIKEPINQVAKKVPVAPSGKVFVRIGKRFADEIITPSGIKFYLDPTWKPEWNVCIHGDVVSIPHKIGLQIENRGIYPEVQVGDRIYFSYQVALKGTRHMRVQQDNGAFDDFWCVDYFHIWCIIRDGEIIAMPGKAIVTPDSELKDEMTSGGLYIPDMSRKKTSKKSGTLKSIGKPLEGEPVLDTIPGDRVIFPEKCAFRNEIEGAEYYVLDQLYLDAREERDSKKE